MNARLPSSILQPVTQKDSTVFTSGNSQAIRIPKEFQLKTKQVKIIRRGDELIIKPKYKTLGELLDSLPPLSLEEAAHGNVLLDTIRQGKKNLLPLRDTSHLFAESVKQSAKPSKDGVAKGKASV
jgi:virulence-associated protein VagC